MLEDTTRINLLYDFYGNLLTDKQRECLELYYQDDLSLGEIADLSGISRQGVHDLIKRAAKTLTKAEGRLSLLQRFMAQEKELRRLRDILGGGVIPPDEHREALAIIDRLLD